MNLYDLQEDKFAKVRRALADVFESDFDFGMPVEKLEGIQKATVQKINKLRESGVDTTDKRFQKLLLIAEGLKMAITEVGPVRTDGKKVKVKEANEALDQAEVLLAAKQLADDIQKMAEDLASMQVEDLMSITNAMKEEIGPAEADAFNMAADQAIGSALEAVKAANESVGNAVLAAQGQPVQDMEAPMPMDPEAPAEDPMPMDGEEMPDDFEGADAADEMSDDTGREMKEEVQLTPEQAYLQAVKTIKEEQVDGKISKDAVKKAFENLKMLKPAPKAKVVKEFRKDDMADAAKDSRKIQHTGSGNNMPPKQKKKTENTKGGFAGGGAQHAFDNKKPKQGPAKPAPQAQKKPSGKGGYQGAGTGAAAFK